MTMAFQVNALKPVGVADCRITNPLFPNTHTFAALTCFCCSNICTISVTSGWRSSLRGQRTGSLPVNAVLNSPGMTGMWLAIPAVTADVVDQDELQTGQRREGGYPAVYSWIIKAGIAIGYGLSGPLLEITGFDAKLGAAQLPDALFSMRIWNAIIPAVSMIAAFFFIIRYPLTAASIVNWDDDYVTASQLLQDTQSTANGDWNTDGTALDQRRWIAFSASASRQPASGYTAAASRTGSFTDGVIAERYGASGGSQQSVGAFTAGTVGVLNSATDDRIRLGSDTAGEWVSGVVCFPKSGFLFGNPAQDTYRFTPATRLTLTIASRLNSEARFVVVSKGVTYVSTPFTTSQSSIDPAALSWFTWTFVEGDNATAHGLGNTR